MYFDVAADDDVDAEFGILRWILRTRLQMMALTAVWPRQPSLYTLNAPNIPNPNAL